LGASGKYLVQAGGFAGEGGSGEVRAAFESGTVIVPNLQDRF
jgi:hypothetical protein